MEYLRKYEVKADSIEDFYEKYHKKYDYSDKFYREQRDEWFEHSLEEFNKYGCIVIPDSTTLTGFTAVWFGNNNY